MPYKEVICRLQSGQFLLIDSCELNFSLSHEIYECDKAQMLKEELFKGK